MFTYDTTAPVMVDGWDPATEYSDGIIAMSNMYETLTRYNSATNTVEPLLATSWSNSADGGKTWTFHLRHGVTLPHRPADDRAGGQGRDPAHDQAERRRRLRLGRGEDDRHARPVHAGLPPELPGARSTCRPRPTTPPTSTTRRRPGSRAARSTKWFNAGHDAGTGPYTVQTWNKGQEFELCLKQFGKYWGGWTGSHYTKVVFRVVPQDTTAAQLLRSGQVTFVEQISPSLWASFKGDSEHHARSARRPGRTCSRSSTSKALEPAGAPGDLVRDRLPGIIAALHGAGRPVQRHRPARPVRALQRPAGLLLRPGQGGGSC